MLFKFMPLSLERCLVLRAKNEPSSWTSLKDLFPLPVSLLYLGCAVPWSNSSVCLRWYNCKLLLQFAHLSDQLLKFFFHTFKVSFQSRLHIHLLKFNSVWKKVRDKLTNGRTDGLTDWRTHWLTDERTDGRTDGRTVGVTDCLTG